MKRTILALLLVLLPAGNALAQAPSPGCGAVPPRAPPATLTLDGEERRILTAVPEDYDRDAPHRLILAYHGRTNPAEQVRRYYSLERAAEAHGDVPSIVVYPSATRQADGTFIWRMPEDLLFLDAIVERIGAAYCIDQDAIFAVGHSLGATFVNTLACARGGTLRGIGSVAGGIMPADCTGETAALLVHNRLDRLVPVETGRRARDVLIDLNDLPPLPAARFSEPWRCWRYGAETARNPVGWCLHGESRNRSGRFYPHTWPEDAARAFTRFFNVLQQEDAAGWHK